MEESSGEQLSLTLNVLCAICCEFFKKDENICSTTKCGHVFHHKCLLQWLPRSKSCPQCRTVVHQHNVHRLFLSFDKPTPMEPTTGFDWICVDEGITVEELSEFGFRMDLDKEGEPIFAARVQLMNDLLPAYYVPKLKGVFTAWNCVSHFLTEGIEFLDISNDEADYKWVASSNGDVPQYALKTGYSATGEILYIARASIENKIRYGKLHPSHRCAYIPYKDKEVNNVNYEVLVRTPKSKQ